MPERYGILLTDDCFAGRKSVFLILTLIIYGALCIPGAWLDGFTKPVFDTLAALYVVYAVVTLMIAALLNIYIPHLMNTEPEMQQHSSPRPTEDNVESHPAETVNPDQSGRQKVGTWLSVFGIVANYAAGIIILVLGIILSATLPFDRQQAASVNPSCEYSHGRPTNAFLVVSLSRLSQDLWS